jgi:hypothetical protein
VKNNTLELQLPSLTDVELEISHGGQTLNRLLMKIELMAARTRLEAATAWSRYQTAKAKSSPRLQLAALLDTAYQAHQAWAQVDPGAAQHPLAQVAQERHRFLTVHTRQSDPGILEASTRAGPFAEEEAPGPVIAHAPDRTMLEREMQAIRDEIHHLMTRVTPWADAEGPARRPQERKASSFFPLLLGGVLIAGLASIFTGYMLQRRGSEHARQGQRVLRALQRPTPAQLTSGSSRRGTAQRHPLVEGEFAVQPSAPVVRHLHLSYKTTRRVRIHTLRQHRATALSQQAEHTAAVTRVSHGGTLAPVALIEALANLRQNLLNLQHLLMTTGSAARTDAGPGRRAHRSPPPVKDTAPGHNGSSWPVHLGPSSNP